MARYDPKGIEAEFEPGSRGRVLRNKLGIKRVGDVNLVEARALQSVTDAFIRKFHRDHSFSAKDIRDMHRTWLSGIYEWAGEYRNVNVSKGGFPFALARRVPSLMADFEKKILGRRTPCRYVGADAIAEAVAEVHVELVLIHPFREGNGRIARLLATLMALQAGLPLLDFAPLTGKGRQGYYAAIQRGLDRDYEPMVRIFSEVIERSLARS